MKGGCKGTACEAYRMRQCDMRCERAKYSPALQTVTIPATPEPERIESMCLRYDHSFGIRRHIFEKELGGYRQETAEEFERRREATRTIMRQLYEEATGQGFYKG